MYYDYAVVTPDKSLTVDLKGDNDHGPLAPAYIDFAYIDANNCARTFRMSVQSFQVVRSNVPLMADGAENKLLIIKYLRGLSGLSLKTAKDVTEYMLAHFTRFACIR